MKREMICIVCPRGCQLCAEQNGENVTVTGNSCPRGEKYARDEMIAPTRTVTGVVRVKGRPYTVLSVKTLDPIPKDAVFSLMEKLRAYEASAPVAIGETLFEAYGTRVVATGNLT